MDSISSHRRRQDPSTSTTTSELAARTLEWEGEYLAAQALMSPAETLKRTLSVRSVISTSSRFAERMNKMRELVPIPENLSVIGRGSCGTIYEVPGTEWAFKKASDVKALWNDFHLTNRVVNSIEDARAFLNSQSFALDRTLPTVAECHQFIVPNDTYGREWWRRNKPAFPQGDDEEGSIFAIRRILPLPQPTREALIKQFCAPADISDALADPRNEACLIRVYLGKRLEDVDTSRIEEEEGDENDDEDEDEDEDDVANEDVDDDEEDQDDKDGTLEDQEEEQEDGMLQNFPLHLDQMEQLELEPTELAEEMAMGLAVAHWGANVDCRDTEFVLGSFAARAQRPRFDLRHDLLPPRSMPEQDFHVRTTHMFMLDFDKARTFDNNPDHVKTMLVPAAQGNDPYFPSPAAERPEDRKLWETFSKAYLRTSAAVLHRKSPQVHRSILALPKLFLDEWERVAKESKAFMEDQNNIMFG